MNEKVTWVCGFLTEYGKPIEIVAMLVTMFFIAFQTLQMNLNIDEIKKSVVLDSHQAVHEHRQRINRILLDNDDGLVDDVFGIDKPNLIGHTLAADYESLFNMRCNGLLPIPMWHDLEIMIHTTLNQPFMKEFWKEHRPVSTRFASYIRELTKSKQVSHGQVDRFCI